ncbi:hypothetical protein [Liquorilactobacillus hordei]|uniref:Uncharacterized protein n=1 Tax=Liquorilactobacillus hordei DSM 19519 TaxID=1423759 RepID=A0A0R1MJP3_9LACO|nr:hypothetical protein [Liquorilactobacillus hordei]KRL07921.1 hypothetical protein FC92_GL000988 [Liquorilactobacillus hordei DSM 19519]QYH50985.1 hypothetical protein G6O70_00015 [Liquorilactobacillus hordei DSM 19519]QYH51132.1 hypothetical protein G6O70_00815 [Liquorilactobacillus hordei DSM 19519]
MKNEGLKQLARDLYHKKDLEFEGVSGNQALRNMIMEKVGGEFDYYSFEKHKTEVFEILSVAVDAVVPEILTNQFDNLADVRNVPLGQKPVFRVEDPRIIRVAKIASGSQDLRRQTVTSRKYTIETDWFGAKVYAEFEQFMNGEIDWSKLVDNVSKGFSSYIESAIGEAFTSSYSGLSSNDKFTGKLTLETLVNLAQRIQVKSGTPVAVYGTKLGLARAAALVDKSDVMKDEFNKLGYIGTISGIQLIEIPQAFKVNTNDFALDDNSLLILPQNEKIVGVVMEGQSIVKEIDNTDRNDMQLGFTTLKKIGISVLQMKVYGMINMNNA